MSARETPKVLVVLHVDVTKAYSGKSHILKRIDHIMQRMLCCVTEAEV